MIGLGHLGIYEKEFTYESVLHGRFGLRREYLLRREIIMTRIITNRNSMNCDKYKLVRVCNMYYD